MFSQTCLKEEENVSVGGSCVAFQEHHLLKSICHLPAAEKGSLSTVGIALFRAQSVKVRGTENL